MCHRARIGVSPIHALPLPPSALRERLSNEDKKRAADVWPECRAGRNEPLRTTRRGTTPVKSGTALSTSDESYDADTGGPGLNGGAKRRSRLVSSLNEAFPSDRFWDRSRYQRLLPADGCPPNKPLHWEHTDVHRIKFIHLKWTVCECFRSLTIEMTACGEPLPEWCSHILKLTECSSGPDVLKKPKLPARL